MQIKSIEVKLGDHVLHEISLDACDLVRIALPGGTIVTVAPDVDAVIVQRFEQDHESMVAVNAPLLRADKTRPTVAMCAPNVVVQQLEPFSFKM